MKQTVVNEMIKTPPVTLYFYWVLLIAIFSLTLCLFLYRRKKHVDFLHDKKIWDKSIIPLVLVILGFMLYFLELLPSLFGYFDFKSMSFVHGYEEVPAISFVRFIYKMIIGILLLIYGLMGKHSGEEH